METKTLTASTKCKTIVFSVHPLSTEELYQCLLVACGPQGKVSNVEVALLEPHVAYGDHDYVYVAEAESEASLGDSGIRVLVLGDRNKTYIDGLLVDFELAPDTNVCTYAAMFGDWNIHVNMFMVDMVPDWFSLEHPVR